MKKSMIAFGVAALCGAVSFADVQSANVVGYMTQNIVDGTENMGGISFLAVDGDDIDLNANVQVENLVKSDLADTADRIMVWDPSNSGYTTYYFYNAEGDEENWGWHDENFELPDAKLPAGTAFWFMAYQEGDEPAEKNITVSGAVEDAIVEPFEIVDGTENTFVNPYPCAIDLNDEKTVILANVTKSDMADTADRIMVWDPSNSGYTTYYFYNAEGDEENWGWHDENFELSDAVLPAGTAFWLYAYQEGDEPATDKTIQFVKPF